MKTEAHRLVTDLAIQYCKDILCDDIKQNASYIIDGISDEDETQLYTRITNWHFYRATNSQIPKKYRRWYGNCRTTSEYIFSLRLLNMKYSEDGSKEYYNNLGRVLHHIQDMSTPSHVVPIYHGIFTKDYFEKYMVKNINNKNKNILDKIFKLDNTIDSLESLYNSSAIATQKYIKDIPFKAIDKNNVTVDLQLSKFWRSYDSNYESIEGFGTYGDLHKGFKKKIGNDINGYKMIKEELDKINIFVYKKAIQDTCDALIFVNNFKNKVLLG
jgi:hypothetical protein